MRTTPRVPSGPGSRRSEAPAHRDAPDPLAVRLGIASGLVVGDLIGAGAPQQRGLGFAPGLKWQPGS
jgi:hypothetical protein